MKNGCEISTSRPPEMIEQALKGFRQALRERSIAAREAMDPAVRSALAARIRSRLAELIARVEPRRLGFCWPVRAEVDLRDLVGEWLARDALRVAALPVVIGAGAPMTFRRWVPGCAMVPDAYGIDIPAAGETIVPDCLVLPLVAFDDAGYRLGYGAGHFDRTIAAMAAAGAAPTLIGIGFELTRCPTIRPQPHDAPLDWLVTDAGIFARDGGSMRPSSSATDR